MVPSVPATYADETSSTRSHKKVIKVLLCVRERERGGVPGIGRIGTYVDCVGSGVFDAFSLPYRCRAARTSNKPLFVCYSPP